MSVAEQLGEIAYTIYRNHLNRCKDRASKLPEWKDLDSEIKEAWIYTTAKIVVLIKNATDEGQ